MRSRKTNDPNERLIPFGEVPDGCIERLLRSLRYVGSPNHKKIPSSDYGFHPPNNPRETKSLCDDKRHIKPSEARALFQRGIRCAMFSVLHLDTSIPKYVWSVTMTARFMRPRQNPIMKVIITVIA